MSILIKSMDMPTGNNAVSIIIFPNGKVSLANDYRFAKCAEAVPVPPHGDLIDRDELPYNRVRIIHPTGDIGGWNAVVMSAAIKDATVIIPADEGGETR